MGTITCFPGHPPCLDWQFQMSSWALVFRGRKPVMDDIAKKLEEYESDLKKTGLGENPSAIEQHARWWFQHHVKRKSCEVIALSGLGSRKSYDAEYVRKAVWKLSRKVGIRMK
jgi:transposase